MNTITYEGSKISVSEEIAEFLESDRKRQAAQERSDRRHIVRDESNTIQAIKHLIPFSDSTCKFVLKRIEREELREAMRSLCDEDQLILHLYYYDELTMQEIADIYEVSKMAISKRIKKLLSTLRELMET